MKLIILEKQLKDNSKVYELISWHWYFIFPYKKIHYYYYNNNVYRYWTSYDKVKEKYDNIMYSYLINKEEFSNKKIKSVKKIESSKL